MLATLLRRRMLLARHALQVMAEVGRIGDDRCTDALRLLESKRLPDGGFPLEEGNATRADRVISRGSFAGGGPTGTRRSNPLVSLAAWRVFERQRLASGPPALQAEP